MGARTEDRQAQQGAHWLCLMCASAAASTWCVFIVLAYPSLIQVRLIDVSMGAACSIASPFCAWLGSRLCRLFCLLLGLRGFASDSCSCGSGMRSCECVGALARNQALASPASCPSNNHVVTRDKRPAATVLACCAACSCCSSTAFLPWQPNLPAHAQPPHHGGVNGSYKKVGNKRFTRLRHVHGPAELGSFALSWANASRPIPGTNLPLNINKSISFMRRRHPAFWHAGMQQLPRAAERMRRYIMSCSRRVPPASSHMQNGGSNQPYGGQSEKERGTTMPPGEGRLRVGPGWGLPICKVNCPTDYTSVPWDSVLQTMPYAQRAGGESMRSASTPYMTTHGK